jgi:Domain of unknown function (DUF4350)
VSEYGGRDDAWTEAQAATKEQPEPREGVVSSGGRANEPSNTVSEYGGRANELFKRYRWIALVVVVVGLSAAIAALTVPRGGDSSRLGPDNAAPQGSRAVVQVLRRQGVAVQPVRRSAAVQAAAGDGVTTLVTDTGLLDPDQLRRLANQPGALVLVEPDEVTLSAIVPWIRTAGLVPAQRRDPACTDADAQAAGRVRAGGHLYSLFGPDAEDGDDVLCYPAGGADGSYVVTGQGGRTVTVIGQSDVLTNRYLAEDGNAALALRALGGQPELSWYTPDPLELARGAKPPTLTELLPDWVLWVAVQLVVGALVAMAWRARRLGRLVPEPLPVVVRAAETQEGRARLYRQASARGRAAATLRTGTLRRLATRLAAPPGTSPEHLVTLVAAATGADEAVLRDRLLGGPPGSDAALVALADDLDSIEHDLSVTTTEPTTARG